MHKTIKEIHLITSQYSLVHLANLELIIFIQVLTLKLKERKAQKFTLFLKDMLAELRYQKVDMEKLFTSNITMEKPLFTLI